MSDHTSIGVREDGKVVVRMEFAGDTSATLVMDPLAAECMADELKQCALAARVRAEIRTSVTATEPT